MKKLTIVAIFCIVILALVGCSNVTEHSVRTYTEAPNSTEYYGMYLNQQQEEDTQVIEEEQVEEQQTRQAETQGEEEDVVELQEYDTQNNTELKGVLKQMYVKIIDEQNVEELNPNKLIIDGMVYTHPLINPNVDLNALGYKQFFIDDFPPFDSTRQKVTVHYYDDGTYIHRGWRVENLTEEEIEAYRRMRENMGE